MLPWQTGFQSNPAAQKPFTAMMLYMKFDQNWTDFRNILQRTDGRRTIGTLTPLGPGELTIYNARENRQFHKLKPLIFTQVIP